MTCYTVILCRYLIRISNVLVNCVILSSSYLALYLHLSVLISILMSIFIYFCFLFLLQVRERRCGVCTADCWNVRVMLRCGCRTDNMKPARLSPFYLHLLLLILRVKAIVKVRVTDRVTYYYHASVCACVCEHVCG
jgi:hypothetical protein